ncbi:hypothetical protein PAXRUDRAFT_525080 [Paxillus rubicundulus Ve08.2h10]|uniref:Uncharacterized protein n=1 Tax=Paxillus rubicundulus Ve08.2h10 TaxID=930991 RepID=A0A0D0D8E3_9AGAM|nr:hypothetical protein PAXRUDRAFT_525080 [Paxillus rubicundulus Ve08.2h10]
MPNKSGRSLTEEDDEHERIWLDHGKVRDDTMKARSRARHDTFALLPSCFHITKSLKSTVAKLHEMPDMKYNANEQTYF